MYLLPIKANNYEHFNITWQLTTLLKTTFIHTSPLFLGAWPEVLQRIGFVSTSKYYVWLCTCQRQHGFSLITPSPATAGWMLGIIAVVAPTSDICRWAFDVWFERLRFRRFWAASVQCSPCLFLIVRFELGHHPVLHTSKFSWFPNAGSRAGGIYFRSMTSACHGPEVVSQSLGRTDTHTS